MSLCNFLVVSLQGLYVLVSLRRAIHFSMYWFLSMTTKAMTINRLFTEHIEDPEATSAILKHCKDFHHPLPSIDDFNIIDKEPSQVTREAKEVIHIRQLDPSLNRNIGKMSIPHCFDNLLGAKPKHPRVGELSVAPLPVEEVAPPVSNTRPKFNPIQ